MSFPFVSVAGDELFEKVSNENTKMTEAEVIHFMTQICEALRFMHENSIAHLDLKVHL